MDKDSITGMLDNSGGITAGVGGGDGLTAALDDRRPIPGALSSGANFYAGIGSGTMYTGPTSIIPKAVPQILDTNGKIVRTDITVWAIPYAETENEEHGWTVTIGG